MSDETEIDVEKVVKTFEFDISPWASNTYFYVDSLIGGF